jgi:hypothetical protein
VTRSETTVLMRKVNRRLRDLNAGAEGPIAFFCECGDPECYRPVWLTALEFDEAGSAGADLLADHRRPSKAA